MRRSRREILLDILRLLRENPLKKTEIMHKCNLSWSTLDEALELLLERNLAARENPPSREYAITRKGMEILKLQDSMQKEFS